MVTHLLNPYNISQAIRAMDSHLLSIEIDETDEPYTLIYIYEVAGKRQPFRVPLTGKPAVDSIVALYPEARRYEAELHRRYGIEFLAHE